LIRFADRRKDQWLYWLQVGLHIEELEGALLDRCQLRIEQEGAIAHRHGVAGEGGEIGDEGLEAVYRQIVVGALGIDLALCGFGASCFGDDGSAGGVGCRLVVIVEQDGLERLAHVPFEIVGEHT
jgi:hypothetical protein